MVTFTASSIRLDVTDDRYPDRVRRSVRKASPVHVVGNVELLDRPAVGICGSRNATESALKYAQEFGAAAAAVGFVVVSGGAKGVDRAAHVGALSAGGDAIIVMPDGINDFRIPAEMREYADSEGANVLAMSPFEPEAGWTVYRAMARNKYIVGLASALFVVEAKEKGGTIDAGRVCLKHRKPLYVIEFAAENASRAGNRTLIGEGGVPVRTMRELRDALELLRDSSDSPQQLL